MGGRPLPRALLGAHRPTALALQNFPSLNKLRPFEAQSPAHTEPVFPLKIPNLAKTEFSENRYKLLNFPPRE